MTVVEFHAGSTTHRMRDVGAKCNAAESFGRYRLLLRVDYLAILVKAADVNRARRTSRIDTVAGRVAVASQDEYVVEIDIANDGSLR